MANRTTATATERSLNILREARIGVTKLLNQLRASQAGYVAVRHLAQQIDGDIEDALERSSNETIRLGILGGRGSGKSTLANSLMDYELLPRSAQIFCTLLPTTITYNQSNLLIVESDYPEYSHNDSNISLESMKSILSLLTKESENPNNIKKVSRIVIGIPHALLDGKEIVDVPGFTKGNPLHQAFAEQYAQHFCDVCLVLINNPESIEIGSREGLEALAHCIRDRLDSTIFLINKCDEGDDSEIEYLRRKLSSYYKNSSPLIFAVSARNALQKSSNSYEFNKLMDQLILLSNRRVLILVQSSLGRLISSFKSLKELCNLTSDDL